MKKWASTSVIMGKRVTTNQRRKLQRLYQGCAGVGNCPGAFLSRVPVPYGPTTFKRANNREAAPLGIVTVTVSELAQTVTAMVALPTVAGVHGPSRSAENSTTGFG